MPKPKDYDLQLENALRELVQQADEDTPEEFRSRHFKNALEDAKLLLKE